MLKLHNTARIQEYKPPPGPGAGLFRIHGVNNLIIAFCHSCIILAVFCTKLAETQKSVCHARIPVIREETEKLIKQLA